MTPLRIFVQMGSISFDFHMQTSTLFHTVLAILTSYGTNCRFVPVFYRFHAALNLYKSVIFWSSLIWDILFLGYFGTPILSIFCVFSLYELFYRYCLCSWTMLPSVLLLTLPSIICSNFCNGSLCSLWLLDIFLISAFILLKIYHFLTINNL
jgi:hypothetical protein